MATRTSLQAADVASGGYAADSLANENSTHLELEKHHSSDEEAHDEKAERSITPTSSIEQDIGVTKIEALYLVFGKGWKLWLLWLSIGIIAYVYALSQNTTYVYSAFATSSFGEHTIVGTIAVITAIMAAVAQPFIAKMADLLSRPMALLISLTLYVIGYAITAGAPNIKAVVAGQAIYTLGQSGIYQVQGILIADITSLQWRGLANGLYSLPFIINAFVAGYITTGISAYSVNGWRWGYGMFCILVPVCLTPSLVILFWGDSKAKKVGALSLASSSYARRRILENIDAPRRSIFQTLQHYWSQIDAFGLLLIGFSFACLLAPATLSSTAKGGFKNPSLIAMTVVGGILFIGFMVWEFRFAAHPIMPRRVMNRTFLCCIAIDFLYFFTGYLTDTYYLSWVYIIKPEWSDKNYTYFSNILTVGLCLFAAVGGLIQRVTHRYKALQLTGLAIRLIGEGINFLAVNGNHSDAVLVTSRVLISMGGGISVTSTTVAAQGSVPHADMALAMAVLSLWTQLGGSIASAISAAVWDAQVPRNLEKYVGHIYNATERAQIFGSILVARAAEPHDLIDKAYTESLRGIYLGALITCFLSLCAGFLTKEFVLGDTHNTIELNKEVKIRSADEVDEKIIAEKARAVEDRIRREVGAQ
ncbi:hypothetical protein DXG03_004097 [Asterophora parasitica]|uniref:Major facilitator superfamily (MFS) profile domain-containing protein n=1 Tax=Asterophora parasitica TaxID=117018 RepID=A0A9P7G716_9AGAR|nr:hypothetical protein DXG03_004097 [Asterophora parasitica]